MTPKKIAEFALGPIAGALLSLVTLPIITWFFSQEDIGRLAMMNVLVSFSILLFSLGLDQAYVREFYESKDRAALFKLTIMPGLLLLLIILGFLLSLDNIISYWLFGLDSALLSFLVAAVILSSYIARFLSLILRMNEKGLAYSMSQLLPKLLLVLIIVGYVAFSVSKDLTNLVLANVMAILFVCIIYAWNTRSEWLLGMHSKVDFNNLKRLLNFGLPLIIGGLAFWGLTAADKIFIKELANFQQLGLYSVAVSFAAAAVILKSVFSTVWAPVVFKWVAAGENFDKIVKVNRYMLLVIVILFCFGGLFSWLVALLLPDNYSAVQWILITCLGYPLLYTLSETTVVGISVTRRSSFAMLATVLAFIVNIIGNWLLIPTYGAAGAAVSTCLSFWLLLILRTEFSIYLWKPMPRMLLYVYTALLVGGAVLNCLTQDLYSIEFKVFWLMLLLSVLLLFKEEIREIKTFTYKKLKLQHF